MMLTAVIVNLKLRWFQPFNRNFLFILEMRTEKSKKMIPSFLDSPVFVLGLLQYFFNPFHTKYRLKVGNHNHTQSLPNSEIQKVRHRMTKQDSSCREILKQSKCRFLSKWREKHKVESFTISIISSTWEYTEQIEILFCTTGNTHYQNGVFQL